MIPYGKQSISQQDIDEVVSVLQSDFLTQGPKVPQFEQLVCQYTGARYASATNSATSALHLACLALGVGNGDTVWTSPISFVASSNCALYCGATVDFVDVCPTTANMCSDKLENKLIEAEKTNSLPKVVIPVHLTGSSCDMEKIHGLSQRFGFKIIEDASHAIGASYQGKPVGNGQYSDITVFSFHPVKIVTTAEGGVAATNDELLHRKIQLLRSHGITKDESEFEGTSDGPWYYQQQALGFNYRMTELQAALGCSQFDSLKQFIDKRNDLAATYQAAFKKLDQVDYLRVSPSNISSFHLFVVLVAPEIRNQLFEHLRQSKIGVNLHYIPIHLQPFYRQMGFADGDFPNAESYYQKAISIPLHPQLTDQEQQHIIDTIAHYVCKS